MVTVIKFKHVYINKSRYIEYGGMSIDLILGSAIATEVQGSSKFILKTCIQICIYSAVCWLPGTKNEGTGDL